MYLQTERPYKEDTPFNTIHKIRAKLANINCMVFEEFWGNPYANVYSVRITTDKSQGYSGTNGKGRNNIFALASAYAEFIERLQNGLLFSATAQPRSFLDQLKKTTGFSFFPDEKLISRAEFDALPDDIMTDFFTEKEYQGSSAAYFKRLQENGYNGCLSVPFFDVKQKKVTYIPFNLLLTLIGSNGMAAGNTPAEGIFQALCEIMERYAAFRVLNEQITPPSVPREYLKNFASEYKIIRDIEESGVYQVIVKDFSTHEKFPVLGVIIINREKQSYRLNVGSDTCFQVALSRCLTEIYQGSQNQADLDRRMHAIPEKDDDCFLYNDGISLQKRMGEYQKFTIDGSGRFPMSLFSDQADYAFNEAVFSPANSYEKEVPKLIQHMTDLGYSVYIRDVSFLGFPSFLVYIPQLSPVGKKNLTGHDNISINEVVKMDKIEDLFFSASSWNDTQLLELTSILDIEDYRKEKMADILHLSFDQESDWSQIPVSFFLTLFWYKLGQMEKAIINLKSLMKETKTEDDDYYLAILKFFELKKSGSGNGADYKQLLIQEGYSNELSEEVLAAFLDPANLFANVDIPVCPDCAACALSDECLTRTAIQVSQNINLEMKKNNVMQAALEKIVFDCSAG